jgi:hypothetical protein
MKLRHALCMSAFAGVAIVACADRPLTAGEETRAATRDVAPYGFHEECADLGPGDRLDYRFESTAPVKFNIHYHDAGMVIMPITRDDATSDAGVFAPRIRQVYCLMWEAGVAAAAVAYRMQVRHGVP